MADILVIIVCFNGMKWLERCIGSVRASRLAADIFVVDNGSTDGSVEWLRAHAGGDLTLHVSESNLGFGAANNLGMRHALDQGYSYVYLLNQDAWVEPDTFGLIAARMKNGYGILSPMQYDATLQRLDANFDRKCSRHIAASGSSEVADVPFVMAAHWMLSTDCIRRIGGFSPTFHLYGEDDDYLNRARFHGVRYGVVKDARAVHDRAERQMEKDRLMRLKCIGSVVALANPCRPAAISVVLEPLRLIGMSVRHWSMIPLRFTFTLIGRYPEILKNRLSARRGPAFL